MTVYVDSLRSCLENRSWRWKVGSHLFADDLPELHRFARRLGLKRNWFQAKSTPHYNLTERKRKEALDLGAEEISTKEAVLIIRQLRMYE